MYIFAVGEDFAEPRQKISVAWSKPFVCEFRFYTYGSFPLERHLQQINEQVLTQFQPVTANTSVPSEQRWQKPVIAHDSKCIFNRTL